MLAKTQDKLIDTSVLTEEVNMEFGRAMNKITFDYSMVWRRMPELHTFLAPLKEEFISELAAPPRLYVLSKSTPSHLTLTLTTVRAHEDWLCASAKQISSAGSRSRSCCPAYVTKSP